MVCFVLKKQISSRFVSFCKFLLMFREKTCQTTRSSHVLFDGNHSLSMNCPFLHRLWSQMCKIMTAKSVIQVLYVVVSLVKCVTTGLLFHISNVKIWLMVFVCDFHFRNLVLTFFVMICKV